MSETITITLPENAKDWKPELFPGSEEAFAAGCTCPVNQPWPGGFRFAVDCPVHEMAKTSQ